MPTKWRRQHNTVDDPRIDAGAFRPFWKVETRLDQLLAAGQISWATWAVANRFRTVFEAAHRGELAATWAANRIFIDKHCGTPRSASPGDGQLQAIEQLTRIKKNLGTGCYLLVVAAAVIDQSWCVLDRQLGIDSKTAKAWTVTALEALVTGVR